MKWSLVIVFFMYCHGLSINQKNSNIVGSEEGTEQEVPAASQNAFYPSFSRFNFQPLGHSRPFFFNNQQERAYSQRSEPFQQIFESPPEKFGKYKEDFQSIPTASSTESLGLLGSGNFGVIPGGTFYNENEKGANYGDYDSYYHNGHGRPSYSFGASNPKPYKHEQFANFRDFADINTPDRQYSQYVVVYVNKNGTEQVENHKKKVHVPKNIMESLTMLDLEETAVTEETPKKKLSKSKRKLAKLLPEKKHLVKNKKLKSDDMKEPLLALS